MYQKFIINQDGVLKFGHVYLHKDLLARDERCPYGGGLWKIDEGRRAILLYASNGQESADSRCHSSTCRTGRRRTC